MEEHDVDRRPSHGRGMESGFGCDILVQGVSDHIGEALIDPSDALDLSRIPIFGDSDVEDSRAVLEHVFEGD